MNLQVWDQPGPPLCECGIRADDLSESTSWNYMELQVRNQPGLELYKQSRHPLEVCPVRVIWSYKCGINQGFRCTSSRGVPWNYLKQQVRNQPGLRCTSSRGVPWNYLKLQVRNQPGLPLYKQSRRPLELFEATSAESTRASVVQAVAASLGII